MAPAPTVSAVVGAYNAERFIAETIDAILAQSRPPDEVIVVDDGSSDRTARVLEGYGDAIRVVCQENGGCPCAFNRAFREARGDYVAMCGADDVWEPHKLEWQLEALRSRPEIDVVFGAADNFGALGAPWPAPPETGIQNRRTLIETLFRDNIICASSVLIRRSLSRRLGPFVEGFGPVDDSFWTDTLGMDGITTNSRFSGDDYDYWMRALQGGAVFFFDPRLLVRYRRHDDNVTKDSLWVQRSICHVHHWHADLVEDRRLRRSVVAADRFHLGRLLVDAGHPAQARTAFVASLRLRLRPRGLAWALLVSLPERVRRQLISAIHSLKGALPGASSA
jgi:glycosyltransferase involved in cell wall biosynthesis